MKLLKNPWLYISLNLGLLPGLALAPDKIPTMNVKTYETGLYMQMWANYSREQKEREWADLQPCAVYEQETGKEAVQEEIRSESESILQNTSAAESTGSNQPDDGSVSGLNDGNRESPDESRGEPQTASPLYAVGNQMMAEDLQNYLWQRLSEAGIEWFMPYAVLIAKQESDFNIYAENPNGRDKGLYQYRIEYVPWMNWQDPYQQIDYFVAQMANRAHAGKTVSEMISAHNMSDYGPYNQAYVDTVMSHAPALQKVR